MNLSSPLFTLKGKSIKELEDFFFSLGEPRYRGMQAFRRINKHLARSLDEFTEFSLVLRRKLQELSVFPSIQISHLSEEEGDYGKTKKALFSLPSNRAGERQVEAVWIPSHRRRTVCISSQAGCSLNCLFCATGTLPFRGGLQIWEIVDQAYEMTRSFGENFSNIVFMGMGEPFHNYENVIRAAHILHHPEGLNIGARHITISTAGVIPAMESFIKSKQPFELAVSLNHTDTEKRSEIMDVNRKNSLERLLKMSRKFTKELGRKITFEYVMIPEVNIGQENVKKLIQIAHSIPCRVNLIPLNTNLRGWSRPSPETVYDFQTQLLDAGVTVFNRGSPGLRIGGACGMLALQKG